MQVWIERWMARLPLPLTAADRDAGFWWELSMRQVETSRTLVFDGDVHARAFFEALLCENMDLGRPENVELLFRRGQRSGRHSGPPPGGGFKTKIDRYCDLVTLMSPPVSATITSAVRCPIPGIVISRAMTAANGEAASAISASSSATLLVRWS